jgi:hypothetical protein
MSLEQSCWSGNLSCRSILRDLKMGFQCNYWILSLSILWNYSVFVMDDVYHNSKVQRIRISPHSKHQPTGWFVLKSAALEIPWPLSSFSWGTIPHSYLPFDYLTVAMEMAHLYMMKMMMYLLQNMILLFANRNKWPVDRPAHALKGSGFHWSANTVEDTATATRAILNWHDLLWFFPVLSQGRWGSRWQCHCKHIVVKDLPQTHSWNDFALE